MCEEEYDSPFALRKSHVFTLLKPASYVAEKLAVILLFDRFGKSDRQKSWVCLVFLSEQNEVWVVEIGQKGHLLFLNCDSVRKRGYWLIMLLYCISQEREMGSCAGLYVAVSFRVDNIDRKFTEAWPLLYQSPSCFRDLHKPSTRGVVQMRYKVFTLKMRT